MFQRAPHARPVVAIEHHAAEEHRRDDAMNLPLLLDDAAQLDVPILLDLRDDRATVGLETTTRKGMCRIDEFANAFGRGANLSPTYTSLAKRLEEAYLHEIGECQRELARSSCEIRAHNGSRFPATARRDKRVALQPATDARLR